MTGRKRKELRFLVRNSVKPGRFFNSRLASLAAICQKAPRTKGFVLGSMTLSQTYCSAQARREWTLACDLEVNGEIA